MGFYSPTTIFPGSKPITYKCRRFNPLPSRARNICFSNPSNLTRGNDKIILETNPQFNCDGPTITPLTTDVAAVKLKINALYVHWDIGRATYSTLGVVWGHRLLAPTWRTIWNDSVHPVAAASNVRKVLVLLTDGADNHIWEDHRSQACTIAKNAGIEIITIYAGFPASTVKAELEKCASPVSDDADEDDTNSFTSGTEEELEGAFETIGRRLRPLRLMH